MIPWATFDARPPSPRCWMPVNETNLHHFELSAHHGPSQLRRAVDSPMLESADERRFFNAQAQIQTDGFETEHCARMQQAIQTLFGYFSAHRLDQDSPPSSPHADHVPDFRTTDPSTPAPSPFPRLDLDDAGDPPATATKQPRSPLALQDLMNPEPAPVLATPAVKSAITPDESPTQPYDLDDPSSFTQELQYVRAASRKTPQSGRFQKPKRLRDPGRDSNSWVLSSRRQVAKGQAVCH